jgi:hypothetical protein
MTSIGGDWGSGWAPPLLLWRLESGGIRLLGLGAVVTYVRYVVGCFGHGEKYSGGLFWVPDGSPIGANLNPCPNLTLCGSGASATRGHKIAPAPTPVGYKTCG